MRINLYQTLGNLSSLYESAVLNSQGSLSEQTQIIDIVENQLNQAKQKLSLLETEQNNTLRLIEINDYYGEKYSEHSSLMKYIIFMMIPIIIITFLFNKGLLPKMIYYILLGIIAIIGCIFIVYRLLSIWNRDNMNYQAYSWSFNAKDAPSTINNSNNNDPWLSNNSLLGTCIGDNCCASGMTFNTTTNQCVSSCSSGTNNNNNNSNNSNNNNSHNSHNSNNSNNNNNNSHNSPNGHNSNNSHNSRTLDMNESFMNNIFTKKSSLYKKPDVVLNSYVYPSNF